MIERLTQLFRRELDPETADELAALTEDQLPSDFPGDDNPAEIPPDEDEAVSPPAGWGMFGSKFRA